MKQKGIKQPFSDTKDEQVLTTAIIDAIREPLIVLSDSMRIIFASRSFHEKFGYSRAQTKGALFYKLGKGEWDTEKVHHFFETILPAKKEVQDHDVLHTSAEIGKSTLLFNAKELLSLRGARRLLVTIEDVSERRGKEVERANLMHQKDILLKEMRHRIANSLQLIASVILLKAETVQSDESRKHLEDAHDRILSIATIQRNLEPSGEDHIVPVVEYLRTLCESLAKSMVGGKKPIELIVSGDDSTLVPDDAISIGLVTTELIMNSLKHAFPKGEGVVKIKFSSKGTGWKLSIADNGIGISASKTPRSEGLGTNIVDSIAKQLQAIVERKSSPKGTTITIVHPEMSPPPTK